MAAAKKHTKATVTVDSRERYHFNGDFHRIIPNEPIYNEKGKLCGVTNPREIVHVHSYGGEAPFFEGVAKGILRGTKCANEACENKGSTYLPFRIYCPDCLEKMKIVDLTKVAKKSAYLHSFMVTERTGAFNTLKIPIKFINVELEGVCTILMSYLSYGMPEMGMKVIPIFKTDNPSFTILDLSWVPDGTPESKLPAGYYF